MTQALQLLFCVAVAALIGIVSLFVDRWEKSREGIKPEGKPDSGQEAFDFTQQENSEETPSIHRGAAMSSLHSL